MNVLRVAVPVPLSRTFDYLPRHPDTSLISVGMRVSVPFGPGKKVGFVVAIEPPQDPDRELKKINAVLDAEPILTADILRLVKWASNYYHHPLGDAFQTALPVLLRTGREVRAEPARQYVVTDRGRALQRAALVRAPVQWGLLEFLRQARIGKSAVECRIFDSRWASAIKPLLAKGLVEMCKPAYGGEMPAATLILNSEQKVAADRIRNSLGSYQAHLLRGVTGSGKTAVYIDVAREVVRHGKQVLFLVPEIGLTPQLLGRLHDALNCHIEVMHSALNDTERLLAWRAAAAGDAQVLIGTRSAVFTPMPTLALIVVDEEHDSALKQQDGFRYQARDLALVRGKAAAVPVVLGSATPSLESLQNAVAKRFELLELNNRAGNARPPTLQLLDVGNAKINQGVSEPLEAQILKTLARDEQVIVFINRRGFAPVLICEDCNTIYDCAHCDAHMTVHARSSRMRCHHCGAERSIPHKCGTCESPSLLHVGAGTERVDEYLSQQFPDAQVLRLDRDVTSRKGELERRLALAASGEAQIIVGTQMLAKGHDFPNVTLVGILDADQGLFGADFRSVEQMGQMIVQVAGRAGRAEKPGRVLVQTRNPENPLLQLLVQGGYQAFSSRLLQEREEAGWPPYAFIALLRADAPEQKTAHGLLQQIVAMAETRAGESVLLLGPAHAPMERIAGRYRCQLLISCQRRDQLHALLHWLRPTLEQLPSARKVRWSLDVDPHDMQ